MSYLKHSCGYVATKMVEVEGKIVYTDIEKLFNATSMDNALKKAAAHLDDICSWSITIGSVKPFSKVHFD